MRRQLSLPLKGVVSFSELGPKHVREIREQLLRTRLEPPLCNEPVGSAAWKQRKRELKHYFLGVRGWVKSKRNTWLGLRVDRRLAGFAMIAFPDERIAGEAVQPFKDEIRKAGIPFRETRYLGRLTIDGGVRGRGNFQNIGLGRQLHNGIIRKLVRDRVKAAVTTIFSGMDTKSEFFLKKMVEDGVARVIYHGQVKGNLQDVYFIDVAKIARTNWSGIASRRNSRC